MVLCVALRQWTFGITLGTLCLRGGRGCDPSPRNGFIGGERAALVCVGEVVRCTGLAMVIQWSGCRPDPTKGIL